MRRLRLTLQVTVLDMDQLEPQEEMGCHGN